MKIIHVYDKNKKLLAVINQDGNIRFQTDDTTITAGLNKILENAFQEGIPYRTGKRSTDDGKIVYSEIKINVQKKHPNFMEALADFITKNPIGGVRAFARLITTAEGVKDNERHPK